MKKLVFSFVALCCYVAASMAQNGIPSAQPGEHYGKTITKDGAINVQQLESKLTTDSTYTGKVEGKVVEVCKKKGCFIRVQREGEGNPILVRFTDYGFFMLQDIVGKTVILEGQAKVREVSVAKQTHFAEDTGKDSEEITKKERKKDEE